MAVLSTPAKGAIGYKAAKGVAKNPGIPRTTAKAASKAVSPAAKVGIKVAKPVVKRRARRRGESIVDTARTVITTLAVYAPPAAEQLGLVEIETPKQKRTAPRIAAGVVIGASAVYFLEPASGKEHRKQVMSMIS